MDCGPARGGGGLKKKNIVLNTFNQLDAYCRRNWAVGAGQGGERGMKIKTELMLIFNFSGVDFQRLKKIAGKGAPSVFGPPKQKTTSWATDKK